MQHISFCVFIIEFLLYTFHIQVRECVRYFKCIDYRLWETGWPNH